MDRRRFLELASATLALTIPPSFAPLLAAARVKRQPAALLVPLTGPSASLGLSMQRAAALAQPIGTKTADLMAFDTRGTAEGAAAAAALALKRGALMILGPLFGGEVRGVIGAVGGRIPILTFSNDETLRDAGAFLLGITATQSAAAILGYARERGVRKIAMLQGAGGWAMQLAAAAARLRGELGLEIVPVAASDLPALTRGGGGELPDALLVADGGEAFVTAGRQLQGSGVQLLGTVQAIEGGIAGPRAVQGAWIAAPDPAAFAAFARDFEQRNGTAPGAIAALAFDASTILKALQAGQHVDRAGLIGGTFPVVTGALRFREDGSATRKLAILIGEADGFAVAPG